MTRFLKIICATLHKEFGFGGKRLTKLVFKAQEFMLENKGNEIFWDKLDELLIDRLGIPFEREDYEEREQAVIENAERNEKIQVQEKQRGNTAIVLIVCITMIIKILLIIVIICGLLVT